MYTLRFYTPKKKKKTQVVAPAAALQFSPAIYLAWCPHSYAEVFSYYPLFKRKVFYPESISLEHSCKYSTLCWLFEDQTIHISSFFFPSFYQLSQKVRPLCIFKRFGFRLTEPTNEFFPSSVLHISMSGRRVFSLQLLHLTLWSSGDGEGKLISNERWNEQLLNQAFRIGQWNKMRAVMIHAGVLIAETSMFGVGHQHITIGFADSFSCHLCPTPKHSRIVVHVDAVKCSHWGQCAGSRHHAQSRRASEA